MSKLDWFPDYLTFQGNPVPDDRKSLVELAKMAGMPEEKIAQMLNGLFKAPTPPPLAPSVTTGPTHPITVATSDKLCNMVLMRLRIPQGASLPMQFMAAHETNDKVFVFMVHKGDAALIEDDSMMFPSDALITKLRLLLG